MVLADVPAFYYGTSPNKFFDYISSGVPVVNNYPGWLCDMIQENDCGRVVPAGDPVAFADALCWLAEHPEERQQAGTRARALAESSFDRAATAERLVNLITASS
jgi:glycosyltransferase involved in cell wall biosynthesis